MDKNKDSQVSRASIFIASLIVIFLSVTYAFINMTVAGTKRQVITTGNLQIEFGEGNAISLTNMMPMYDEVGIIQESFDFKVINPTDRKMHYTLTLVDITKGNHLSNTAIRCGITKDGTNKFYDLQRVIEGTVDEGVILENQTINYQLRLWISDSVENNETIENQTFSYRVDLGAIQEIEEISRVIQKREYGYVATSDDTNINIPTPSRSDYYAYSDSVTSIEIENEISIPDTTPENQKWDISEAEDGSVMAYVEENGTLDSGEPAYQLHLQANGEIKANSNSGYLFYGFPNLVEINGFQNLDLSSAKNLEKFFGNCNKLKLDLSHFNTSNVTNMSGMFSYYESDQPLNLDSLDTSAVTSMDSMFLGYSSSQPLDLSKLNTTNVVDMSYMFSGYSSVQPLDLSKFNTSSVTNMSGMFSYYESDQPLNLNTLDTSNVVNMSEMFLGYSSNQPLDISGFDISKVKESSGIFDREKEYYESKILVKNEVMKAWVLEQNPELINVLMK